MINAILNGIIRKGPCSRNYTIAINAALCVGPTRYKVETDAGRVYDINEHYLQSSDQERGRAIDPSGSTASADPPGSTAASGPSSIVQGSTQTTRAPSNRSRRKPAWTIDYEL